jgi:hypothetical protein
VDVLCGAQGSVEGGGGAGGDGDAGVRDQGEDAEGVACGLLERHVPSDRGDGEEIQVPGAAGEHDRHGVVMARVDVEDYRLLLHHRKLPFLRARVHSRVARGPVFGADGGRIAP